MLLNKQSFGQSDGALYGADTIIAGYDTVLKKSTRSVSDWKWPDIFKMRLNRIKFLMTPLGGNWVLVTVVVYCE